MPPSAKEMRPLVVVVVNDHGEEKYAAKKSSINCKKWLILLGIGVAAIIYFASGSTRGSATTAPPHHEIHQSIHNTESNKTAPSTLADPKKRNPTVDPDKVVVGSEENDEGKAAASPAESATSRLGNSSNKVITTASTSKRKPVTGSKTTANSASLSAEDMVQNLVVAKLELLAPALQFP